MNELSATIRKHVFLGFTEERDRENTIVDFEIDGRLIREMVKFPVPPPPPQFDPGVLFVGRSLCSVNRELEAYRTGIHTGRWPSIRHVIALTACADCGYADCGGVWTEVHVGGRTVFWSKLAFSGGDRIGPVYDRRLFAFERRAYERLFDRLREAALAENPV